MLTSDSNRFYIFQIKHLVLKTGFVLLQQLEVPKTRPLLFVYLVERIKYVSECGLNDIQSYNRSCVRQNV